MQGNLFNVNPNKLSIVANPYKKNAQNMYCSQKVLVSPRQNGYYNELITYL